MKMEAIRYSETSVTTYETTMLHNTEYHSRHLTAVRTLDLTTKDNFYVQFTCCTVVTR